MDRADGIALGLGLAAGAAIAGVCAYAKSRQLMRRGAVLERALEARGSDVEAYLALRGAEAERSIAAIGSAAAEQVAQRAAEEYLQRNFGLTPARVQAISRLGSMF